MFMTGKRKEETSVFVRNKAKLGKAGVAGGRDAGRAQGKCAKQTQFPAHRVARAIVRNRPNSSIADWRQTGGGTLARRPAAPSLLYKQTQFLAWRAGGATAGGNRAKQSQFAEPPGNLGANCTNKANSDHGVKTGKAFAGKELW